MCERKVSVRGGVSERKVSEGKVCVCEGKVCVRGR